VSKDELINGLLHLVSRVCACDKKIAKLENSCEKLKIDVFLGDKQLEWFRRLLDELSIDYDALKAENDLLKSNASMPCNSCIALHNDLDLARNKIALLKSNAFFPCGLCESLFVKINELTPHV